MAVDKEKLKVDEKKYPQAAKLAELQSSMQAIGAFLEWYGAECGAELQDSIENLIYQYFEIDATAYGVELEAMIEESRDSLPDDDPTRPIRLTKFRVIGIFGSTLFLDDIVPRFKDYPPEELRVIPNGSANGQYHVTFYADAVTDEDAKGMLTEILDLMFADADEAGFELKSVTASVV